MRLHTQRDRLCGFRSFCQTWRTNKRQTVRLAGERVQHSYYYTHTHTHTHSDERCAWLSIDSGSVDPTGMSDSCSLHTLTHLHTHTHTRLCRERQMERNSFFLKNAQCQWAPLKPVEWKQKRSFAFTVYFISTPGVLLNDTNLSR